MRNIPWILLTKGTEAVTEANNPFAKVADPIVELLRMALDPALAIVGALGAIYCIFLGAKLAKAEEPQDREKAKNSLKNAIIGFVLIFVLIVVLKIGMGAMATWMDTAVGTVK